MSGADASTGLKAADDKALPEQLKTGPEVAL